MNIYLFHSILIHIAFVIILMQLTIKSKNSLNNKKYYIDFISSKTHIIENIITNNSISETEKKDISNIKKEEVKKIDKFETKEKVVKNQKQIDDPDYLYKNISKLKPSMAKETPTILNENLNIKDENNKHKTDMYITQDQGGGIKTDNDFPYPWYISKLRTKLWDNWQEQTIIAKEVSAIIKFKIHRNGEILDIEIDKSSGNKLFDYSALNSVIKIKNFDPLPIDFKDNYLTVYVEFKSTY